MILLFVLEELTRRLAPIPFFIFLLYLLSMFGIFVTGIYQIVKKNWIYGFINLLSFFMLGFYTLDLFARST